MSDLNCAIADAGGLDTLKGLASQVASDATSTGLSEAGAAALLAAMAADSVAPDGRTYTAAISAFSRSGEWVRALALLPALAPRTDSSLGTRAGGHDLEVHSLAGPQQHKPEI